MHFLDRSGCARVVATAADDRQLVEAVRQLDPDVVIAQPGLVDPAAVRGPAILALETRESVASLRSAIRVGARGFYVWPGDREALAEGTAATAVGPVSSGRRGRVIAVHAARGGAGATFVATHLAAAFARRDISCSLIDADPLYGDVSAAVGAPVEDVHTFADCCPWWASSRPGTSMSLVDAPRWVPGAPGARRTRGCRSWRGRPKHRRGSRRREPTWWSCTCLAPSMSAREVACPFPTACSKSCRSMCCRSVPQRVRSRRWSRSVCEAGWGSWSTEPPEASTPGDVTRVFGVPPLAVLPFDRAVGRAQDHGRILPGRGRVGRAFDRLAAEVLESGVDVLEAS